MTFAGLLAVGGLACAKTADTQTETGEAAPAQTQTAAPAGEKRMANKKVLVAYYSYSGNTAAVARQSCSFGQLGHLSASELVPYTH